MIKEDNMFFVKKYYSLAKELFLYGVIGCFSALMDIVIFTLLVRSGMWMLPANFISINLGIGLSFLLNTFLNFKKKDRIRSRMLKFFSAGYAGMALSMGIMWTGVNMLGIEKVTVKIASACISAAVQYMLNKFVTFRY